MTKSTQRIPLSRDFDKIRQNIYFVLVEPATEGNIGATARALKTTGLKNLILVNPKINKDIPEARWMAHQSEDILDDARVCTSIDEAIKNKRLVIATTQRKRSLRFPLYSPVEITEKICECAISHPCAIVFGREHNGLKNEELVKCHLHSTIVTATTKPALNLAQAVMIYAYTIFSIQNVKDTYYKYDLASQAELEKFYQHLREGMNKVGFVPRDNMDNFITRFKRMIGRAMAEKCDIRLLHKLLQIFENRIDELERRIKENK